MNIRLARPLAISMLFLLPARTMLAAADPTEAGTWQTHELHFEFKGFQSAYSCDWLEEKMRALLDSAGVRKSARLTRKCKRMDVPAPGAALQMTFDTLALASAVADPAAQKSEPAVWRQVVLYKHRPYLLEASDCELVQQFRDQVLPLFTTRNVSDHMHCAPNGDRIDLQFEVLVPAATSLRSAPVPASAPAR